MKRLQALGVGLAVALVLSVALVLGSALRGPEEAAEIMVPSGAGFGEVTDTLTRRGVVHGALGFRVYARLRGDDRNLKSGRYVIPEGAGWSTVLSILTEGRVVTVPMTIPEGFWLVHMAPRIAEIAGVDSLQVMSVLAAPNAAERFDVPGPGLEGYLFPDTYRFARGVAVETVVAVMAQRYRDVWTPSRRTRLDSLGLSERELVTLASIVQAEARMVDEMPTIASVYHNRLDQGWLLQADPTVLYALGGRRERLLYAAIDSVADHPYNTYGRRGLPPGPIGAPGELAIQAALYPADTDFMYFVARPDGSHAFTRTLAEHNREKEESRRERDDGLDDGFRDGLDGGANEGGP